MQSNQNDFGNTFSGNADPPHPTNGSQPPVMDPGTNRSENENPTGTLLPTGITTLMKENLDTLGLTVSHPALGPGIFGCGAKHEPDGEKKKDRVTLRSEFNELRNDYILTHSTTIQECTTNRYHHLAKKTPGSFLTVVQLYSVKGTDIIKDGDPFITVLSNVGTTYKSHPLSSELATAAFSSHVAIAKEVREST